MPLELRILLVIGAVGTQVFFLRGIRRSRMQIGYAISWTLFSALLVVMSVFPSVFTGFAEYLGFESPANMVYLVIIFALLLKQFSMTVRLSKMDEKLSGVAQTVALLHAPPKDGRDPAELIDRR